MTDLYADTYGALATALFTVTVNADPVAPPTGSAVDAFSVIVNPAPTGQNNVYADTYVVANTPTLTTFTVTINPPTTTISDLTSVWTGTQWKTGAPALVWTGSSWR